MGVPAGRTLASNPLHVFLNGNQVIGFAQHDSWASRYVAGFATIPWPEDEYRLYREIYVGGTLQQCSAYAIT